MEIETPANGIERFPSLKRGNGSIGSVECKRVSSVGNLINNIIPAIMALYFMEVNYEFKEKTADLRYYYRYHCNRYGCHRSCTCDSYVVC